MSTCKSCGASIVWALSTGGKRIPIDVEPSRDGNVRLTFDDGASTERIARVVQKGSLPDLHTSHFATCPQAAQHRRKGSKGAA